MSVTNPPFVTCDLLDDHPECQVAAPYVDGKMWRVFGGNRAFGGPVVTVKCFEDNSRVKETLATPGNGRVLVVDGGGSMRCALLGDLIAESAVQNGWAGVVVYGCVRDVDALAQLPLGVMALGCIPQKSHRRGLGDMDIMLNFAGLTIKPGQYLYADANGLIVSDNKLI